MEIKKTFEYSIYKQVNLSFTFKNEEEYKALMQELARIYVTANNRTLVSFIDGFVSQLEAPCS